MEGQLILEQIINAASDGVIATDAGSYIVFINKEAETFQEGGNHGQL